MFAASVGFGIRQSVEGGELMPASGTRPIWATHGVGNIPPRERG
jgi:hypothetical protein